MNSVGRCARAAAWWVRPRTLRMIGLTIKPIREDGKIAARWVCCLCCGAGLFAIWCRCGLKPADLARVLATHVETGWKWRLLQCPSGCNSELIESPPGELLEAILGEEPGA